MVVLGISCKNGVEFFVFVYNCVGEMFGGCGYNGGVVVVVVLGVDVGVVDFWECG